MPTEGIASRLFRHQARRPLWLSLFWVFCALFVSSILTVIALDITGSEPREPPGLSHFEMSTAQIGLLVILTAPFWETMQYHWLPTAIIYGVMAIAIGKRARGYWWIPVGFTTFLFAFAHGYNSGHFDWLSVFVRWGPAIILALFMYCLLVYSPGNRLKRHFRAFGGVFLAHSIFNGFIFGVHLFTIS